MMARTQSSGKYSIRIHLTNVVGAGASQLLQSLLPALEVNKCAHVDTLYLPDQGPLQHYSSKKDGTQLKNYLRYLPNALSRVLECTVFGSQFSGILPLLVLGDLPIRCNAPQTVFVQTAHLLRPVTSQYVLGSIKFRLARFIFQRNQKYAQAFIVQTRFMHDALIASYPELQGRVHVVAQPVPSWLLEKKGQYHPRKIIQDSKLRLIYPAAGYPHKNHKLLGCISSLKDVTWPVETLRLTIEESANPAVDTAWVECLGFLCPALMIKAYAESDGLVFLSLNESYGFPLIEAMFIGLPIICPNLPYAKALCGPQAIYFDVADIKSLHDACVELKNRLMAGWRPDWSDRLAELPQSWESVSDQMLEVMRCT